MKSSGRLEGNIEEIEHITEEVGKETDSTALFDLVWREGTVSI